MNRSFDGLSDSINGVIIKCVSDALSSLIMKSSTEKTIPVSAQRNSLKMYCYIITKYLSFIDQRVVAEKSQKSLDDLSKVFIIHMYSLCLVK